MELPFGWLCFYFTIHESNSLWLSFVSYSILNSPCMSQWFINCVPHDNMHTWSRESNNYCILESIPVFSKFSIIIGGKDTAIDCTCKNAIMLRLRYLDVLLDDLLATHCGHATWEEKMWYARIQPAPNYKRFLIPVTTQMVSYS